MVQDPLMFWGFFYLTFSSAPQHYHGNSTWLWTCSDQPCCVWKHVCHQSSLILTFPCRRRGRLWACGDAVRDAWLSSVNWWWMGPSHTWGPSDPLSFTALHKHLWQLSSCSVSEERIQGEMAWPQKKSCAGTCLSWRTLTRTINATSRKDKKTARKKTVRKAVVRKLVWAIELMKVLALSIFNVATGGVLTLHKRERCCRNAVVSCSQEIS